MRLIIILAALALAGCARVMDEDDVDFRRGAQCWRQIHNYGACYAKCAAAGTGIRGVIASQALMRQL